MFRDYREFWKYCLHECPNERLGCAKQCELRRALKQPPFGSTYKLSGIIAERCFETIVENRKAKFEEIFGKEG